MIHGSIGCLIESTWRLEILHLTARDERLDSLPRRCLNFHISTSWLQEQCAIITPWSPAYGKTLYSSTSSAKLRSRLIPTYLPVQ